MIVADTSGLIAFFNRSEPAHGAVSDVVASTDEPLVVSPYVVAEVDYLLATRVGVAAELDALRELAGGGYLLAAIESLDLHKAAEVIARYRDQAIGVADASLVVLADRYRTRTILTLDRRNFDVVRPIGGGRFRLIP